MANSLLAMSAEMANSRLTVSTDMKSLLTVSADMATSLLAVSAEMANSLLAVSADIAKSLLAVSADVTNSLLAVSADMANSLLAVSAEMAISLLAVSADMANSLLAVSADVTNSLLAVSADVANIPTRPLIWHLHRAYHTAQHLDLPTETVNYLINYLFRIIDKKSRLLIDNRKSKHPKVITIQCITHYQPLQVLGNHIQIDNHTLLTDEFIIWRAYIGMWRDNVVVSPSLY
jgi:hypothetical protein